LNTSVFIWDEFLSNNKHCFNAVYNSYDGLQGKVFIALGDDGQIGPVVVNGKRADTSRASIINHPLWKKFKIFKFTKNLRLLGIANLLDFTKEDDVNYFNRQLNYAKILEYIRLGNKFSTDVQAYEIQEKTGITKVRLPFLKFITDKAEAMEALYPQGFNTINLHQRAILCATNTDVDEWNSCVQDLNPETQHTFISRDEFSNIDDPKGILHSLFTEDACMFYRQNGVPDHKTTFKKGDLCFIMRTLNRKEKLANNTRVIIKEIYRYSILVETISDFPKQHLIPRIKFEVKLRFGGFVLSRTQFPLRLSYAMTKNKSQGQSIPYSMNDIRHPPFSHGHLYVSMSRATDADQVCFFCNTHQIEDEAVIVENVVYEEMLLSDK
jgi:ATP-dependent exoDNAse (exonuclease V) alpha subunit